MKIRDNKNQKIKTIIKKSISSLIVVLIFFSAYVPVLAENWTYVMRISTGSSNTFFILSDGRVKATGNNEFGQLGIGNAEQQNLPLTVAGLSEVKQIAVGLNHTIALLRDGTVMTWGSNEFGQLGIGNTENSNYPVNVPGLSNVKQITAGGNSSYALLWDGTVKTWGHNSHYVSFGDGNTFQQSSPVIIESLFNVKQIDTGFGHTLAVLNDGTVRAWGWNQDGELGVGENLFHNNIVIVSGLSNVREVVAGTYHSIALLEDGTVKTWGRNTEGQLGIGNNENQPSPRNVPEMSNVKQLSAGTYHSMALMNDGTVKAWGENILYQIGDGTRINKNVPTVISKMSGVSQVEAGGSHSFALLREKGVKGWGYGGKGQLGTANYMSYNYPTDVSVFPSTLITPIIMASDSVFISEIENTQPMVEISRDLVNSLEESNDKSILLLRIEAVQEFINGESEKRMALLNATTAVEVAEKSKLSTHKNTAIELVSKLPSSSEKTSLFLKLDAIVVSVNTPAYISPESKLANKKIKLAEALGREPYLKEALVAIDNVIDQIEKESLTNEMSEILQKLSVVKLESEKHVSRIVRLAEITGRDSHFTLAEYTASQIIDEAKKANIIVRISVAKLIKTLEEKKAYNLIILAEQWKRRDVILAANDAVNALTSGYVKNELLKRLDSMNWDLSWD